MPDYFNQYSPYAANIADKYGLDRSIFFGLIEQESNWNPFADAPSSSAFGFTQLLKGTAGDLGVNRFNPYENLEGGAMYLRQQLDSSNNNYSLALAKYYGGPGNPGIGKSYASSVLGKAKKYGKDLLNEGKDILKENAGDFVKGMISSGGNPVIAGTQVAAGALGDAIGGGASGILDWLKKHLQDWGQRISIITIGLIVLLIALYMIAKD